ncbi:alpha/beta fold hydrolase [Agromyces mediolanus]|uniref:alpha/beta fold hydrolase n=2 Tax=Agromyces mediolanus TaxID=41986 RepID=UPI0022F2D8CC|nr:alpha/beta fold hydrolase [Agromyces mediolanus]GLJ73779.1 alpha/beta hydrolase [Agromyces mediolanus]
MPLTVSTRTLPAVGDAADRGNAPVVLLHGFASDGETDFVASGLAEAIAASGREAIVVDLPGHGAGGAIGADEDASTSTVVRAISEALPQSGPVDVVAYSLGARLAWALAAAEPRVQRLVLGGLSPFEPFAGVDVAALVRALDGEAPADPMLGMMATMIAAPGRDRDSLPRLIAGLAREPFDPAQDVPAIPVLFVAGADDPMTTGLDRVVEGVARGQLVRVPGDHLGALASPEFRQAVLDFLA